MKRRGSLASIKIDMGPFLRRFRACGTSAGRTQPASPHPVFAEDFSVLVRAPRRLRLARSTIRVLS